MPITKRTYTNGEITVIWEPGKCIHAGECMRGLPSVFNISARPWVDIHGASSEDISRVIDRCPSKALSYTWNNR